MTPTETLRAAAAKLREIADKATPGPWSRYANLGYAVFSEAFDPDVPDGVGDVTNGSPGEADADWIALMSPAVAEPLAAWLDGCAGEAAAMSHPGHWGICDEPDSVQHAIAVARAVLGEAK